ncbi:MAG: hypothetical protein JJLCMIEE_00361 [Acidimicrobiales bacterium]|nr:MAG: hypothetical protein EDR02_17835 [Actinomycetota bacterium]MBV6507317.1 hypothetical protein [Acidimicrobiales bacterium]RIK02962.1 MAG: hypothetical protein DCC48_17375 [Acidobacteriota bacterium]
MSVRAEVVSRIARRGPVPFGEVVDLALYDPVHGFYATGGAGRRADFITSPEVGPLYGAVIARGLDAWWRELDEPDPFFLIDAGAGRGALAASVLDAAPDCAAALRYVMVERSGELRDLQGDLLPVVEPRFVFGAGTSAVDDGEDMATGKLLEGTGPIVTALEDLPAIAVVGVVLANELLDNLSFSLLEYTEDGWAEVMVGIEEGELVEVLVPASDHLVRGIGELVEGPRPGDRVPVQGEARKWLIAALEVIERGRVVVIDYCDRTASLAARPQREWLRTYRAHSRGSDPLQDLGDQDITCEVAYDQLSRVREADAVRTQAAFLRDHGIEQLVSDGRQVWLDRAHLGDLAALKARSRTFEAEALLDEAGLGGFLVLEWVVGPGRA